MHPMSKVLEPMRCVFCYFIWWLFSPCCAAFVLCNNPRVGVYVAHACCGLLFAKLGTGKLYEKLMHPTLCRKCSTSPSCMAVASLCKLFAKPGAEKQCVRLMHPKTLQPTRWVSFYFKWWLFCSAAFLLRSKQRMCVCTGIELLLG